MCSSGWQINFQRYSEAGSVNIGTKVVREDLVMHESINSHYVLGMSFGKEPSFGVNGSAYGYLIYIATNRTGIRYKNQTEGQRETLVNNNIKPDYYCYSDSLKKAYMISTFIYSTYSMTSYDKTTFVNSGVTA